MWHWRQNTFETLRTLAVEASRTPACSEYARFCVDYERGLRNKALATLDGFISELERAPFVERRNFVSWVLGKTYRRDGEHLAIPHPLRLRIIEPTLLEWTAEEPGCAEPHRWIGDREHLRRALELDPTDEIATRKLLIQLLATGTDHLPDGYIGDPYKDIEALKEAESLLDVLSDTDERREWFAEIHEQRFIIEKYLRDEGKDPSP